MVYFSFLVAYHRLTVAMQKERILKQVGVLIRVKRVRMRISQLTLAELAECSLNAIGNIERGKANVSLFMAYRIATALKVNIRDILP